MLYWAHGFESTRVWKFFCQYLPCETRRNSRLLEFVSVPVTARFETYPNYSGGFRPTTGTVYCRMSQQAETTSWSDRGDYIWKCGLFLVVGQSDLRPGTCLEVMSLDLGESWVCWFLETGWHGVGHKARTLVVTMCGEM